MGIRSERMLAMAIPGSMALASGLEIGRWGVGQILRGCKGSKNYNNKKTLKFGRISGIGGLEAIVFFPAMSTSAFLDDTLGGGVQPPPAKKAAGWKGHQAGTPPPPPNQPLIKTFRQKKGWWGEGGFRSWEKACRLVPS